MAAVVAVPEPKKRKLEQKEVESVDVAAAIIGVPAATAALCLDAEGVMVERPTVTFEDVIGHEMCKKELLEMVRALSHAEELKALGARLRRGTILHGESGVGKTMLVKALAHACNCSFILMSAASFGLKEKNKADILRLLFASEKKREADDESQKALGQSAATKLRQVFTMARTATPAIVFLDEFDLLIKDNQPIVNELLQQLDGFATDKDDRVFVIAATNKLKKIDQALVRPGRFDRVIKLRSPRASERLLLFRKYTALKPIEDSVDLDSLKDDTIAFTGAEIETLCNEAALEAFSRRSRTISMDDFRTVLRRKFLGYRQFLERTPEEELRVAYHEAGHALVSLLLPSFKKMIEITILPHESTDGVVFSRMEEDRSVTKDVAEREICVLFGGMCAEQEGMGSQSAGSESDLDKIHLLLKRCLIDEGMMDSCLLPMPEFPVRVRAGEQSQILQSYLLDLKRRTAHLLHMHRAVLDTIAKELVAKKTLCRAEVLVLFRQHMASFF